MLDCFRDIPLNDWNNWKWQQNHSLTQPKQLQDIGIEVPCTPFRMAITPYYANLIDFDAQACPLRQQVLPSKKEMETNQGLYQNFNISDSLDEEKHTVAPNLIHKYPDRALLLVTSNCFQYCRFCTRKRITAHESDKYINIDAACDYLRTHKQIHDILISGGDPLTLEDGELEKIFISLRQISHIKTIRIGTRAPVVLPMRITDALVNMIRQFHPVWINTHFNHVSEITCEAAIACEKIINAGIPLGNQSVLLRGINNNVLTYKELCMRLIEMRIRPYYLYQCDLGIGTEHFRTSIQDGLDIISNLQGFTPGYAVPTYVIDAPNGGGKIPVFPETIVDRKDGLVYLKNYSGNIYTYPEPKI